MNLKDEEVAAELRRTQKDPDLVWGICSNLSTNLGDNELAEAWLEHAFSELGVDPDFPVPHPTRPNEDAYVLRIPKWCGPYGENRMYLLGLLIDLAGGADPASIQVNWPHPCSREKDNGLESD